MIYFLRLPGREAVVVDQVLPDRDGVPPAPVPRTISSRYGSHALALGARVMTPYPMRMEKGYVELQTGATFGLMPSIYEPFGAAIEYMANGTVNIGRRSGGLVNQIVDGKTGFLFRESPALYTIENVKAFADATANVAARRRNPWVIAMVDALTITLRDAAECYRDRREEYAQMVLRGFDKASEFSWEKNATEYSILYRMASGSVPPSVPS